MIYKYSKVIEVTHTPEYDLNVVVGVNNLEADGYRYKVKYVQWDENFEMIHGVDDAYSSDIGIAKVSLCYLVHKILKYQIFSIARKQFIK